MISAPPRPSAGPPAFLRRRQVALIAAALLVPLAASAPPRAAAGVVAAPAEAERPRAYWTAERMRAATPVEPPVSAVLPGRAPDVSDRGRPELIPSSAAGTSGAVEATDGPLRTAGARTAQARSEVVATADDPFRTHGKVFFAIPGEGDFVCSGTAVTASNRSVVWTAGHCVFDDVRRRFAVNWTFVPGYRNGTSPYGRWPARQLATTAQWQGSANLKYDLGAAVVRRNGNGQGIQDVIGARGIGFDQARAQHYSSFGYPATPPPFEFTGQRMYRCDAPFGGNDNPGGSGPLTMWMGCDQTAGASGGSWVAGRTVLSVNSYKYLLQPNRMYGPYMGEAARDLYERARGREARCLGRPVSHLGTAGDDRIRGTREADVIRVRRGNNLIAARGGNDRICAGRGNDRIRAGPGNDRIRAVHGRNRISCGRGRDRVVTNRRSIVSPGCQRVIRR